jgi:hypothetical protein
MPTPKVNSWLGSRNFTVNSADGWVPPVGEREREERERWATEREKWAAGSSWAEREKWARWEK